MDYSQMNAILFVDINIFGYTLILYFFKFCKD